MQYKEITNRADEFHPLCFLILFLGFVVFFLGGCSKDTREIEAQKTSDAATEGQEHPTREVTEKADNEKTGDEIPEKETEETTVVTQPGQFKIGISMPQDIRKRWEVEGQCLEESLAEEGYQVKLAYSETPEMQGEILAAWITEGVELLIVNPVDAYRLKTPLEDAARAGIPVISYQELIMDSSAISYLVAENQYETGKKQGEFLVAKKGISLETEETFGAWFIRSVENKGSEEVLYEGLTDTLLPYIDAGVLTVEMMETATAVEALEDASKTSEALPDIIFCADADGSIVISEVLSTSENGKLAEKILLIGIADDAMQNDAVIQRENSMFLGINGKDRAMLCGKLAKKLLSGEMPGAELLQEAFTEEERKQWKYDWGNYDNGTGMIPAYLVSGEMINKTLMR